MSFFNLFLLTPCSYTNPILSYISTQDKHYIISLSKEFKKLLDKSLFYPLINLYTQSSQNHTYHEFKYISSFQFSEQIKNLGIHCNYQDIIFICDTSGSMRNNFKKTAMIKLINNLVFTINHQKNPRNIGLISFNQKSFWTVPIVDSKSFPFPITNNLIRSLGMTNFDSWINLIKNIEKPSMLVLISDMDVQIRNKNKYIPILMKHFFYQVILPPGNRYTSESLNHISNGYGKYFLPSTTLGVIPSCIEKKLSSFLLETQPQLICYQTHSRYHAIRDFDVSLPSSSFLIEDEQQLEELKKIPIHILFNGKKIEQWDSQNSRFIVRNQACPWEIFKTSLIKKMSHLNYLRNKLLRKEYLHCDMLEEIIRDILCLDINNHQACLETLGEIYNSEALYSIRNNNFFSSKRFFNHGTSTNLLIDLNILICKTITSIEHQSYDQAKKLIINIQDLGKEISLKKIKRFKNDSIIIKNEYNDLFKRMKIILSSEIKTILKITSHESLDLNDEFNGLRINNIEYSGNLNGEQLETLVYLYCCLFNKNLYNFELDGDIAEYIPSLEIDSHRVNQSTTTTI